MFKRLLVGALFITAAWAQPYSANGDAQLAAYLEEALARHPAMDESLARYRAALQRIPQVTALPEPMFEFNPGPRMAETRVGPQMLMMSLSQEFPWFGKLAEKGKVAAKEAAMQREVRETQQAEIIRQGVQLGLDYGLTHSCYDPDPHGRPCHHCDSCMIRAAGFAQSNIVDPLLAR